jgi:hypothetical protein
VKIIDNIKEKVGILTLNKELKSLKRNITFNNFVSAKTVGVIFDTIDRNKYQQSKDFIEFIEKQNIRVFGIGIASKNDQIAYFPYKQGVDYFGLNEINWYGKPVNPVAADFLKRNFDILFDISQSDIFSIQYLFSLSVAKFKITNNSAKSKFADFVLQIDNNVQLQNYIEQIKHYLGLIQIKQ